MAHGPESHGSAREDYDRELTHFVERCQELAQGEGVPASIAHSETAARQWVSDDLTRQAARLAATARKENATWLALVGRQTMRGVWALPATALVVDLVTLPMAQGWTLPRTATLIAFAAFALLFTALGAVHADIGGVLCYLVGVDGRMSLPRTLGLLWAGTLFTALVYFGVEDFAANTAAERAEVTAALSRVHLEYLALIVAPVVVSIVTSAVAAARMRRRNTAYLPGQRSQLRDLLVEETGFGSLASVVWLPLNLAAVLFVVAGLAKNPYELPSTPTSLVWLTLAAGALYCAIKLTEVRRPVLVSVVRVRAPGDGDGPIRPGDEIEIRGLGFVPLAASTPDQRARLVVKLGPVYIHVPLVPDLYGGFANPTDTSVTVPIPFEVEPGPWTVRVVTAAGLETDDYALDILSDDEV